jgi:hypothetical protein
MIEIPPRPTARTIKAPQDTVAGCCLRAEADLLASTAVMTANQRIRLEKSAASWNARAAMLQSADEDAAARKASSHLKQARSQCPLTDGGPITTT